MGRRDETSRREQLGRRDETGRRDHLGRRDQERGRTTTGQAPRDQNGQARGRGAPTTNGQAETNTRANTNANVNANVNTRVNLNEQQRGQIRDRVLAQRNIPRVRNVDVDVAVGTVIPRTVRLAPVPANIVRIFPRFRQDRIVIIEDEVVIVDPVTFRIIAVLPA